MSGVHFASKGYTEAWMKANSPEADSYVYFVDVHNLLSIGTEADSLTASDV